MTTGLPVAAAARKDPEAFWAAEAEQLEWYKKWDKVLDASNAPFFQWFTGGKVNAFLTHDVAKWKAYADAT